MTVRAIHNNYQFEPLDLQKKLWRSILTLRGLGSSHPFLLGTCHACLASTNFWTVD